MQEALVFIFWVNCELLRWLGRVAIENLTSFDSFVHCFWLYGKKIISCLPLFRFAHSNQKTFILSLILIHLLVYEEHCSKRWEWVVFGWLTFHYNMGTGNWINEWEWDMDMGCWVLEISSTVEGSSWNYELRIEFLGLFLFYVMECSSYIGVLYFSSVTSNRLHAPTQ